MFQVLSKVVRTIEFFALVTFPKLVDLGEVLAARDPVRLGIVGEFIAAVAANIDSCVSTLLRWWNVASVCTRWYGSAWIKGSSEASFQSGTRPRVATKVERVLMSLGFVLVLESIVTVLAEVLLLGLMRTAKMMTISTENSIKL